MSETAEPYQDEALHKRIEHNMTNHAPTSDEVIARFEALRIFAKQFSHAIVDLCPEGRDRLLALTHAEDALMRAVAAIARNQDAMVAANMPAEEPKPPFETGEALEREASDALTEREYEKTEETD